MVKCFFCGFISMNVYTLVDNHRNSKAGGGVALLCQKSIEFVERKAGGFQ